MQREIRDDSWTLIVRGGGAIVLGGAAFFWPSVKLDGLLLFFAALIIVDGLHMLLAAEIPNSPHWSLAVGGAVSATLGFVALFWRPVTSLTPLWIIAAWAILTGLDQWGSATELRELGEGGAEWLQRAGGILSLTFGVWAGACAWAGVLDMVAIWLIGAYAISLGVVLVGLGFRLHRPASLRMHPR